MLSSAFRITNTLHHGAEIVSVPSFSNSRIARYVVARDQPILQPLALLADDPCFIDEWVGNYHRHGHSQQSRDISCYFCRNLGVSGRGHLTFDNQLIMSNEFVPQYWRHLITDTGGLNIDDEHTLPIRVIEEPTLVISGYGVDVYGHFLIETLPKLMVAYHVLGNKFRQIRILMQASAPKWLINILTQVFMIDPTQFTMYDSLQERVLLREAVLPTLVSSDGWFHPFITQAVDTALQFAGLEAEAIHVPRIFISRALFSNPSSGFRRCSNEFQLAEIAVKEFSFALLATETLPWRTQIGMFRNASLVVGEYGSALHNTLFSRPGTVVGCIGIASLDQSMIGAARQQRNAYIKTLPNESGVFNVDTELFRTFLKTLIEHEPQHAYTK